ncbi:serine/threonine protein kinase [Streptomyces rectiverticillatus]|uniref:serine/threonine-protein kinase n=1 Tax=Streptomyces rectiverticillatus TaxID=173860 RepID=UPI0015C3E027|nr:serine/threonine-protein kinase [Streptomyces rectiverticillatus]QLE70371.1 serine/threonine protein kinase [Streptomyces rectiverticillatus]
MRMLGVDGPTHVGPFRTVGVLGQGGMGQVLLGVAPDGRFVAVKRVHADLAEDPGFRSRFRREVDASRRVSGAYTAPVVDADPDAPTPWLASLFLPGPSLSEALEVGGVLPEEAVRLLAAGLAQALADIHRAQLVHRDLKPSNVLLTEDGVRVVDFGIARAADHQTKLTHTGALIGSPAYMSPEQVRGEQPGPAGDVFSLGLTLVMASTGRTPFAGNSPLALMHAVAHDVPDLDSVPPRLRRIVEPCLAKDPAARPTPAQLLELTGPLAPSARPWPEAVYQQIAERRAWAARLAATAGSAAPPATANSIPLPVSLPVPATPPSAPSATAAPAADPAPRRRPRWLTAAIVVGVTLATVAATVLAVGPDNVYYTFVPEPVPTPGSTPLAQVPDKYTKTVPTCVQVRGSMKAPTGFGEATGNFPDRVWQQSDADGHTHPSTSCVWNTRSGDKIDINWDLHLSRAGGPTGAEQSKKRYEGMYIRSKTARDSGLGFVEEGMWLKNSTESSCVLYVRDGNLYLFIAVKGVHYPKGACEDLTKDMARQAVAAVTAL